MSKNEKNTVRVVLVFGYESAAAAGAAAQELEDFVSDELGNSQGRGKMVKEHIDKAREGFVGIEKVEVV